MKKIFLLLAAVGVIFTACEKTDGFDDNKKKVPTDEIWYTSTDGKIVTPYSGEYNNNATALETFGANILSNTCKNGKGIIKFDSDITSIGNYAFAYCASLKSITIPDSITSIGNYAFKNCTSLTSVTIPDSVTSIGGSAFYNCNSLTSVTIPNSVTSIGKNAFYECTGELIINSKIVETDYTTSNYPMNSSDGWLYGSKFTKLTIGNSVTKIGDSAFENCTSLTSITIPDSVTKIRWSAFYNCTSLTSVTIGNSVTKIEDYAFAYCTSLTSITIPDNVNVIGSEAFGHCTSLTSVYCKPATPPTGYPLMFDNNKSGRKIYVPRNSVEAYKSASDWIIYASDIVGYDF